MDYKNNDSTEKDDVTYALRRETERKTGRLSEQTDSATIFDY